MVLQFNLFSELVTKEIAKEVARKWVTFENASQNFRTTKQNFRYFDISPIIFKDEQVGYVVQMKPKGFILMPIITELAPIKFITFSGDYENYQDNPFIKEIINYFYMNKEMMGYPGRKLKNISDNLSLNQNQVRRNEMKWKTILSSNHPKTTLLITTKKEIEPLITSSWNQGYPYNINCPKIDGKNCLAGCVSIAFAQIMNYWKYPAKGQGFKRFELDGHTYQSDFDQEYQWDKILDKYSGSEKSENITAAAELISDVGMACIEDWGLSNSGGNLHGNGYYDTWIPLDYFNYSSDIEFLFRLDTSVWPREELIPLEEWNEILRNQVENGFPVYSGLENKETGSGGHAMVFDGYREISGVTMFHANMGWGGFADNYYTVDDVYGCLQNSFAVINIYPENLSNTGCISGKVVNEKEEGFGNVLVAFFENDRHIKSAWTDKDGNFQAHLIPGTYKIVFMPCTWCDKENYSNCYYSFEWYSNGKFPSEALSFTITPGDSISGLYIQLESEIYPIINFTSSPVEGVPISIDKKDYFGLSSGITNFTRKYPYEQKLNLSAPQFHNGREFIKWDIGGIFWFDKNITWYVRPVESFMVIYGNPTPPEISLNHTRIYFGAVKPGAATNSQSILINNNGAGTLNWSAAADQSWLTCNPTSGTGAGTVAVSVNPNGLSAGTYTGTIMVSDPNANNSPRSVYVTLKVYNPGTTDEPFGEYATPVDGSTVASSIAVTGWVIDDIGVESVKIYRGEGNNPVYIGDATFVEGARPDVETAYPDYPLNYRAGWGYMLLTNYLPNSGNGTFKIHAIASDEEGNEVTLGIKTITCDNDNAVKPFGCIDTPGQGGTASGSAFINWGWVLTPQPNYIPTDGSTIQVWVDGVNLGNPVYNLYRSDIATLFPGYANSDGAVGYFYLNTTNYDNGVHTIQWIATDSSGNTDGIGSRYFSIRNTGASRQISTVGGQGLQAGNHLSKIPMDTTKPIYFKTGFNQEEFPITAYPNKDGRVSLEIFQDQRLEISLVDEGSTTDPSSLTAYQICVYQVVNNEFRKPPVGMTVDHKTGTVKWMPGVAFYGNYRLMIIITDQPGNVRKIDINLTIEPANKGTETKENK